MTFVNDKAKSCQYDSDVRCCYRRRHIFNQCSFRISLIVLIILLYIYFLMYPRESPESNVRIMYVVRTISKYYSTRLIYLIETWISLVTNDVFFVSDTLIPHINLSHIITTEIKCGLSSHSVKSLCCQTIHDFILYRRYEFKYDWFCHFDDDQYVNVNNLKEYLSKLNPNVPYYIGRNSWNKTFKRKKNIHPGHFWFATLGAGVCLSKRTVSLLKPYTENVLEFVNGCLHEYYPDDIYLGFLINNHLNISLTKNNLFHSHLERSLFDDKYSFINTFHQQITFGFKSPRIVPKFLPNLFPKNLDPFGMRKLHCFLYTEIKDCKIRLLKYISNTIK